MPLNIKMERVAMLSPYGRRVIIFLGANGVGRQKLKSMLINKMSNYFATTVPGKTFKTNFFTKIFCI